ncbi:hypothetical protein NMY22_g11880 [Coprinellus aureogranulatus]|nr:hypothetical protein NMY22_g11880 [Coprinellus aureogranulatus]
MQSMFEGCKGVYVGAFNLDNVDNSITYIDVTGDTDEDDDQQGTVGVVRHIWSPRNIHSLTERLLYSHQLMTGRKRVPPAKWMADSSVAESDYSLDSPLTPKSQSHNPLSAIHEDRSGTPSLPSDDSSQGKASLLFPDSEDVITKEVNQRNIGGNLGFNAVKRYLQQVAVGVANGDSDLIGAFNIGGGDDLPVPTRDYHGGGYSDSDDTSSSDGGRQDRRYVDQWRGVGLFNDNAKMIPRRLKLLQKSSAQKLGVEPNTHVEQYHPPPERLAVLDFPVYPLPRLSLFILAFTFLSSSPGLQRSYHLSTSYFQQPMSTFFDTRSLELLWNRLSSFSLYELRLRQRHGGDSDCKYQKNDRISFFPVPQSSSPDFRSSLVIGALEDPKLSASTDTPRFTTTSSDYVHSLYRETAEEEEIGGFLKESDTYDTVETRWSIPAAPTKTEELVNAVFKVLSSVVRRFVKPARLGVEREVVNTQDIPTCQGKNDRGYRLCPVVVVRAAGPSFEAPNPRRTEEASQEQSTLIGFGRMATYFSVKLEPELGSEKEELEEMEYYARRLFNAQHNRYHVRSLILTEKHARLVHFDRSGPQITPPLDIHQHPATLVRLVAGLSSVDERDLGIDDSVGWTIVDGRKDQGTLTTTGKNGKRRTYPIIEEIPIPRDPIRGRATTCWRVRDPGTLEELVVKDSWRPDDRHAEHELLKLVKGVRGVVQMVSCEEDRGQTKAMRCPSTAGRFQNRVFERVVMRSYGKPLEFFQSVLQLLCAIRDSIAGHQRLVDDDIRILHRDVSPHNILLGEEDAPDGDRGILIDLDMAFRATPSCPTVAADFNTGTRIFQSLSVLNSHNPRRGVRAHDYLDDLESFFYLLAYVFLRFRPDGTRVPDKEEGPSLVWEWADDCPSTASGRKSLVFSMGKVGGRALRLVEGTWGDVCGALFKKYRRWVSQVRSTKTALLYKATRGQSVDADPLKTLHARHFSGLAYLG